MEHRNSTVITAARRLRRARRSARHRRARVLSLLERRAHPAEGLEPFDFDRANISGELWLAEGFTQYYGPLALQRAKLEDSRRPPQRFGRCSRACRVRDGSCDRPKR
jgi:predicted metalloprotease with PDZ domain